MPKRNHQICCRLNAYDQDNLRAARHALPASEGSGPSEVASTVRACLALGSLVLHRARQGIPVEVSERDIKNVRLLFADDWPID